MRLKYVGTLLLVTIAWMQNIQADDTLLPLERDLQSEDNLYTLEIVIFRQASPGFDEENWSQTLEPLSLESVQLPTPNDGAPLGLNEELAMTDFALSEHVDRLNRNGYQVLYHNSWLEQFNQNTEHTSLLIDPLGNFEGTLRVERQRYLHVYPTLNYYPNGLSLTDEPAQTIRFEESRRMRSKELHYIDHPVLGILMLFRPVSELNPDGTTEENQSGPAT